ncbi:sugar ABC transporter ATP-binding protein [Clostridium sediminicola]|uniref:sugar ABC transporter ATP-binding protein n=1 Tax=Clostridium sediminicola TaxID=3114879 RepID=UPI0031F2427A
MAKQLFNIKNITKKYPGTVALHDVSMEINEGEVIGLVGENGAGKSTLLKLIMGVEMPTSGEMDIFGEKYAPQTPKEANELGIGMVFQEQSVITNLSVGQNIFFGKEKNYKEFGLVNWRRLYKDTENLFKELDLKNIDPKVKVGELNFATRQMVEIAKVFNLVKSSKVENSLILLDEPTSVLNDDEVKYLFSQIEKLKKKGNSVIFVSHRIDEVLTISDRIYVFKDGENVAHVKKEEANEALIYQKMVGRTSAGEYYKISNQTIPDKDIVLEAKNLGLRGSFKKVSFKLHRGEVMGICGVVGSGKEDLCSVIIGDDKYTSGELWINNVKKEFSAPHEALKNGILLIPKERRKEGIFETLSLIENISMSNLSDVKKGALISKKKQIDKAKFWIDKLRIKCSSYKEQTIQLSGGNAQKVVFARILASDSKILVLNHPTRGVDIGAKEEIYNLIREITAKGISVILLGDTLDECIGLSSTILVMKDGLITSRFNALPEDKPLEEDIIKYMM